MRKELEEERALNMQHVNEISRMKSLVQNFEGTKNELIVKLQAVSKEKVSEERDKKSQLDEISHLKKLILEKD